MGTWRKKHLGPTKVLLQAQGEEWNVWVLEVICRCVKVESHLWLSAVSHFPGKPVEKTGSWASGISGLVRREGCTAWKTGRTVRNTEVPQQGSVCGTVEERGSSGKHHTDEWTDWQLTGCGVGGLGKLETSILDGRRGGNVSSLGQRGRTWPAGFLCCKMHHGHTLWRAEYAPYGWHEVSPGFQPFGRLPVRLCRSSGECCGEGWMQQQALCLPGGGVR